MSERYEAVRVGGEMMLISYSTLEQRREEIRVREEAHKAIEESRRECALIMAALNS